MLLRDRDHAGEDLVKVLDFGVAKFLRAEPGSDGADLTRTDAAVGTPRYMAPEQIQHGQDIDFRVDVYALGGILFYMLSGGHAPIEGDTVENVWRRKVLEDPTPLSRWRSDLPAEVSRLVMSCLARDPGGRPNSMEGLRKDLLTSLENLRAAGPSMMPSRLPSSTAVVVERARKRSLGVGLLFAGLGGAIAGGVALAAMRASAPDPAPAVAVAPPPPAPAVAVAPPAAAPAAAPRAAVPPPLPPPPPSAAPVVANEAPAAHPRPGAHVDAAAPVGRPKALPTDLPARPAAAAPESGDLASLLERAETAFQESDHLKAIRLAQQALAERPTVRAWLILGKAYRTTWQYKEALDAYEHAVSLDPANHLAREGRRKAAEALAAAKAP
jgi:serine/threonine-protein kinase